MTHLPQMASYAHHQWVIRKQVERGRSRTTITPSDESDRIDELAADAPRRLRRRRDPAGGHGHARRGSGDAVKCRCFDRVSGKAGFPARRMGGGGHRPPQPTDARLARLVGCAEPSSAPPTLRKRPSGQPLRGVEASDQPHRPVLLACFSTGGNLGSTWVLDVIADRSNIEMIPRSCFEIESISTVSAFANAYGFYPRSHCDLRRFHPVWGQDSEQMNVRGCKSFCAAPLHP